MNTDWTREFRTCTPTQMLQKLLNSCKELDLDYAPAKIKRKPKYSRIPHHRKILMRKRAMIRKSYHTQRDPRKKATIQLG